MEDAKTEERIKQSVRKILEESDLDNITEIKIRKLASKELGINLSQPHFKALVEQVVEDFLQEKDQLHHQQQQQQQQPEEEEEEEEEQQQQEEEEEEEKVSKGKQYNEDGDLIICELSGKRKVTIQDFKGKTLVSIREYYMKGGKELPTAKGISLTQEQWSAFKKNVPAIEKAIKEMESRI